MKAGGFLLIIFLLCFPKAFAQTEQQVNTAVQNSVVKACDQINKKKKPKCSLAVATTKAAAPVAIAPPPPPGRCDAQRTDDPPSDGMKNYFGDNVDVSALTPEEAQQVYKYIMSDKGRYGLAGNLRLATRVCAQRAQIVAFDILKDCKVKSAKIFAQPSRDWSTVWLGRNPLNVTANGRTYHWDNYHVANVIYVRNGDMTEPYVIDPMLFKQPVPLKQWQDLVKQNDSGVSFSTVSSSTYLVGDDDDPSKPLSSERALRDIDSVKMDNRIMQGP